MRKRSLRAAVVILAMSAVAFAREPAGTKPKMSPYDRLVVKPSAELNWTDLDPTGAPGVKVAKLWGDPAKGSYGAFFKLPAGFAVPLHTHTHDIKVVIVSGTYIQVPERRPEFRLGPGSYFHQPGGNYRHTTACDTTSECVFLAESKGKFDLKVVDQGKAAAKK